MATHAACRATCKSPQHPQRPQRIVETRDRTQCSLSRRRGDDERLHARAFATEHTSGASRTPFGQGDPANPKGRDHFGKAYSFLLAGGGAKPGHIYGSTDDYAWNITADPVHIHDMQATIMHLVGIDHTKLTFRYQGRQFRLTDVHGHVVRGVMA